MNALEAIYTRKSVRSYQKKPILKVDREKILQAAMQAPSAYNEQPWQFLIIDDPLLLKKIASLHPHAKMCESAPLAILVCADSSLEKTEDFWVQDCSSATTNILLASHALGIGSVWCGLYPREERVQSIKTLFQLPPTVTPFSLVVLGYSDADTTGEKPSIQSRYDKGKIHENRW
jgi:nitroreductase